MKSYTEMSNFHPSCPEFRSSYCYDLCNWFGVCMDFEDELEAFNEEIKEEMKQIEVGTTVMLCVGHVKDIPQDLKALDQRVFRVKKVVKVSTNWRYYELYGCNSRAVILWCIEESWIQPIKEMRR